MRRSRLGIALILAVVGVVWIGQGSGAIAGSAMSGSSFWAIVGAGLVLLATGLVLLEWRRAGALRG